jgi:hypothetical protein
MCDLTFSTLTGETPLHVAARRGLLWVLEVLVGRADVRASPELLNATDREGRTFLHLLCAQRAAPRDSAVWKGVEQDLAVELCAGEEQRPAVFVAVAEKNEEVALWMLRTFPSAVLSTQEQQLEKAVVAVASVDAEPTAVVPRGGLRLRRRSVLEYASEKQASPRLMSGIGRAFRQTTGKQIVRMLPENVSKDVRNTLTIVIEAGALDQFILDRWNHMDCNGRAVTFLSACYQATALLQMHVLPVVQSQVLGRNMERALLRHAVTEGVASMGKAAAEQTLRSEVAEIQRLKQKGFRQAFTTYIQYYLHLSQALCKGVLLSPVGNTEAGVATVLQTLGAGSLTTSPAAAAAFGASSAVVRFVGWWRNKAEVDRAQHIVDAFAGGHLDPIHERKPEIAAMARYFGERYAEQIQYLTLSMVAVGEYDEAGRSAVRWRLKPQPDDGIVTLARAMVERIMTAIRAGKFELKQDDSNPLVTFWRRSKARVKEAFSSPFDYDDKDFLTLQARCLRAVVMGTEERHTKLESIIPQWEVGGALVKGGWRVLKEAAEVQAAGAGNVDLKYDYYVLDEEGRQDGHRRYGFVLVSEAEFAWLKEQVQIVDSFARDQKSTWFRMESPLSGAKFKARPEAASERPKPPSGLLW